MRIFEHFPSLVAMFFTRAGENGDKPFLWHKEGGQWHSISWAEAARQVATLAAALATGRTLVYKPPDNRMLPAG